MIDEKLKTWASPRDLEIIEALETVGSAKGAARHLGVAEGTVRDAIKRLKTRAAAQGYSPDHNLTHTVPRPYIAKGHSTYYNRDGKVIGQWVKSSIDYEQWINLLQDIAKEFRSGIKPLPPVPANYAATPLSEYLCNQYTFTDVHLGMLAWHEEGGSNWDLKIAEKTVLGCFEMMLARAPSAKNAVIAQLGDFLHSDGLLPLTVASKHVLDQESRYAKVVRAAIRIIRRILDRALEKHESVTLLMAEGNHDESGSIWMREFFAAIYEEEPRILVNTSPLPYYAIKHGKTALFYHHGHKKKPAQLPQLFATQFAPIWGETEHRYAHCGHLHSVHELYEKDETGVHVMQHPTLAARDAYASRGGWFGTRRATSLSYHSEFGEYCRLHVTPGMLGKAA